MEQVEPKILWFKAYQPICFLGQHYFIEIDMPNWSKFYTQKKKKKGSNPKWEYHPKQLELANMGHN